MTEGCVFCDHDRLREADLYFGLHPHLHVIPRFDDEPMADQGVRSGIKDPANRRPDPWRPGTGRHMTGPP